MKHVHVVIRTILLMGLSMIGIATDFGLNQFWACKCPPGFYALGTSQVFASGELCKDKNESFIVGPNDFSTPSRDTTGVTTVLEACYKCAHGCSVCQGPEADQCLECAVDYFAYQTQPDKSDVQNVKRKRSSENRLDSVDRHGQQRVNSQKIFKEDELLQADVDARNVRDTQFDHHQNSQDSLFKEYDDEESSGEVDEARVDLVVHGAELSDILQVPKPPSALENKSVDPTVYVESISNISEPLTLAIVEKSDDNPPKNTQFSNQSSFGDKDTTTTQDDSKHTLPRPSIAQPSIQNFTDVSKIIDQEQVVEDGNMSEMSNAEQSIEDKDPNEKTNTKDIFTKLDKDVEPADEPEERHEPINGSSNADITNENFNAEEMDEKSEISEIVLPTNPNAPLKTPNTDLKPELSKTSGSAPIPTTTYSCLVNCPEGHYNTSNRFCLICHAECEGCFNDGPTNCIKCRNYKKGSTCVASCTSNDTSTEKYNSNCEIQSEEETIPAGYYAIPPLVISLVCLCIAVSYCRRRRKLKHSLPGGPEGMHKTDMHSSEISFTRTHLDNKKCFYKGSKPSIHIAQTEFKNSSETLKRKGNPYVYAERPLLPKYAHQTATNSPAWSACKDMSEPEDDFDPLYETPDNTMDMETLKRYHYRRRSSPSHVHFALTTSKVKEISNSLEDCLDTDSLYLDGQREYDDVDDLRPENYVRKFEEDKGEQLHVGDMEAPYYQAPPLPVRNSPSVQDIIDNDHIYVNIDEDACNL